MRILAIDPGFERLGIAIIDQDEKKKLNLVYSNCFKTKKSLDFTERLLLLGLEVERVIQEYKPKVLSVEKLYFTTNQKTAMNVSEARGVILYCAIKNNLQIHEYTPMQIKVAITGYGKSDKSGIAHMVKHLIGVPDEIKSDDEIDAIAIGLTCFACERFSTK